MNKDDGRSRCRFALPVQHPAMAREVVRSHLKDITPEVRETAELLVSELVTNAIVHANGEATLVVESDELHVHVEVLDLNPTVDLVPLHVDRRFEHGRGLAIVDGLATSWGVERRYVGKAVWFDLSL